MTTQMPEEQKTAYVNILENCQTLADANRFSQDIQAAAKEVEGGVGIVDEAPAASDS